MRRGKQGAACEESENLPKEFDFYLEVMGAR